MKTLLKGGIIGYAGINNRITAIIIFMRLGLINSLKFILIPLLFFIEDIISILYLTS